MQSGTLDQNVEGMHIPILVNEVMVGLNIKPSDIIIDCTANRGGHSKEILKYLDSNGLLICNDLDQTALKELKEELSVMKDKSIIYTNDNFANIEQILESLKIKKVDKIFADLGISSQEVDISGRGFSFQKDEPLLMTFRSNPEEETLTAEEIVNNWSEELIADILYNFADETYARRIARQIVKSRRQKNIKTTFDLVNIIKEATPKYYHHQKTHYATKSFQALRMATNTEIDNIIKLLESTNMILSLGGRIAILTFHSVEDRIVKQKAKELGLKMVYKKPLTPSREELLRNRRARSAKLRIYEYNI